MVSKFLRSPVTVNGLLTAYSADGSYTHHSGTLGCVNFDATTHSVYFANGDSMYGLWTGYGCADCNCPAFSGALPGECVNIDTQEDGAGRIQSAQQNPST